MLRNEIPMTRKEQDRMLLSGATRHDRETSASRQKTSNILQAECPKPLTSHEKTKVTELTKDMAYKN